MTTKTYKGHTIIRTDITTDVYVRTSIGYRRAIRFLYMVDGKYSSNPIFTSIREAKEWISAKINNAKEVANESK